MKTKITPDPRLVEALPWMLFFRDGKSLGQIARECGGYASDYAELVNTLNAIREDEFDASPKARPSNTSKT